MQIDRPAEPLPVKEPRTVRKTGRVDPVDQQRHRDQDRSDKASSQEDEGPQTGEGLVDEYA